MVSAEQGRRSMSARDTILAAVRGARPAAVELPNVSDAVRSWPLPAGDIALRFLSAAQAAGARTLECSRAALAATVASAVPNEWQTVSLVPDVHGSVVPPDQPHAYASVDAFICEGTLGVAENGAIWLPASRLGCRAGAFLAQHMIIVLDRQAIAERYRFYSYGDAMLIV